MSGIRLEEFTHAVAVPGASNIIDLIHPNTGRTLHFDLTIDQVRQRAGDELAEVVELDKFLAAKAARQDGPIAWTEVSADKYEEMLDVLPPAFWQRGVFLVGEPWDHHALTGQPRFEAYRKIGDTCFVSSRPITRSEAKSFCG